MNKEYFLEKLKVKHPQKLEDYNYDLLPTTFLAHDMISIKCRQHGIFLQKAYAHLNGLGCSECGKQKAGNARRLTTDEFISKSKQRHGTKFDYRKTIYTGKSTELIIGCNIHGDVALTPDQHWSLSDGCPRCSFELPLEKRKKAALAKAKEIHGGKYDYSRVIFKNVNSKVEIVCSKHGSFWQTFSIHIDRASNCPKCVRDGERTSFEEFVERSKILHGGKYNYHREGYENTASMITITCPDHGNFTQRAASHLAGCVCKQCYIEKSRLPVETFIDNAREVHGDLYDYSKVVYLSSKVKVEIICPEHGNFWMVPNTHISNRAGCQKCHQSKGEKEVERVLKKYGVEYIPEYRVLPYRYRYDFYLPKLNTFIEFHGKQHYEPVEFFGGEENYYETVSRDHQKHEIARSKKIKLIVLHYLLLTKGTVEEHMVRLFKLS